MEPVRETFGATPELLLHAAQRVSETSQLPTHPVTLAAREVAARVRALPVALLRETVSAVLMGRGVHLALQWMHDAALLAPLLPEIEATVDFSQEAGRRHKDVWEHTKQVVRQSVPRLEVRW